MARTKKPKTSISASVTDPATDYARRVGAGEIVAGPHVRAACSRHLRDLEEGPARGLVWDVAEVERVVGFFRDVLTVEIEELDDMGVASSRAVPFVLQPSQAFIVGSLFGWRNARGLRRFRRAYVEGGKGSGKALALDTPIATPSGWSTMGDLSVGDSVFSDDGSVCRVTAATEVMHGRRCYAITFGDGETIIADADHTWKVASLRNGKKKVPRRGDTDRKGGYALRTTAEVAATWCLPTSSSSHPQAKYSHRVDVAEPLVLPLIDLPVGPYTLGAWLGDGDSDCARLTSAQGDVEIRDSIKAEGYDIGDQKRGLRYRIGGVGVRGPAGSGSLNSKLRALGLFYNKHIPPAYLRSSRDQRLELLRGLLDTDGSASKNGAVEFSSKWRRLADDVAELIRTLGYKVKVADNAATLNGREVGRRYRLVFHPTADVQVFRLSRKAQRQKSTPPTRQISNGRMIVDVREAPSTPVRCISVDSPNSMFICGRTMIPTHNSPLAAGLGHYMLTATGKLRAEVYSAATDKDQAAILFRDAVEMWRRSPALHKRLTPSGQNPTWQLTMLETASFFRPISSEKRGKSGIRPYCALIDEVHEHPDNSVIEMLRAGTKGNQQALIFEITNSGFDRSSVCWGEHEYSIKVASGEVKNDAWFSYICALDDTDEPFDDEACWIKANPLLGITIQPEFIREQVAEARGMPSKEGIVRRLHFCQWTDAADFSDC